MSSPSFVPSFAVLPEHILESSSSPPPRFLRLPNPRTGLPSLYLPYTRNEDGKLGVLEVQSINPDEERSWFFGETVVADGKLLLFTPIDPIFLLIPVLEATTADPSRFLLLDQIFSIAAAHASYTLPPPFAPSGHPKGKGADAIDESKGVESEDVHLLGQLEGVERVLRKVCDVQEISGTDLTAYRLSRPLLLAYLRKKIFRLAKPQTFNSFPSLVRGLARDGLGDLSDQTDEKLQLVRQEARLSHSLSLLQPYLSPSHLSLLTQSFCSTTNPTSPPTPFPLLQTHLQSLLPSLPSTTTSSSSSAGAGEGTGKPPLLKKTSSSSQGVKKLKTVNTKGMADLRGFFGKKG